MPHRWSPGPSGHLRASDFFPRNRRPDLIQSLNATARIDVPPVSQNEIQNLPEMVQRPGKVGSKPEHEFEVTAIPNPPLSLPDPPLPLRFITPTSRCVILPTIGVSSGNAATKRAPLRGGVARSSPARPLHLMQTKGVKTRE